MFPRWVLRTFAEIRAQHRPGRAFLERHERGHVVMRLVFDDGAGPEYRRVHLVVADGNVRPFGYAPFSEEQRIALHRSAHVDKRLLATFEPGAWVRREHLPLVLDECKMHDSLRSFANVVSAAQRMDIAIGVACWGPAIMRDPWVRSTGSANVLAGRALDGSAVWEPYDVAAGDASARDGSSEDAPGATRS